MLAAYLVDLNRESFDLSLQNVYEVVPNLDPPRPDTQASSFAFKGNEAIPMFLCSQKPYNSALFVQRPVIFLYRNPMDVLASFFFYKTRHEKSLDVDLPDFIGQSIEPLVNYLNSWAQVLDKPNVLRLSYETLRKDTFESMRRIVDHLQLPADRRCIERAVEVGAFDNMLARELEEGVRGFSYDKKDPDARRVRRGKVEGYHDYLSPELVTEIRKAFDQKLSGRMKIIYAAYFDSFHEVSVLQPAAQA